MGNVSPNGAIDGAGGGDPFVDAEMKAKLAKNRTPFAVTDAVVKTENQFGDDETRFTIRVKGEDGKFVLTLPFTEIRANQAKACLELLAGGATSVGPLYLSEVTFKSGKAGWQISESPGDGHVSGKADPSAAAVDDDLPF